MANGLDRLERFFTKRKTSVVLSEPSSPTSASSQPQFPSPSFIRPKTSRMAARDDVRKQSLNRSPSILGLSPKRKTSVDTDDSDYSIVSPEQISSPFGDHFLSSLRDFEFPKPPSRNGDGLFLSSHLNARAFTVGQDSRPGSPLKLTIPTRRLDTPPMSEPEDNTLSPTRFRTKRLPAVPDKAPPTPDSSPDMRPVINWQFREPKSLDIPDKYLCSEAQHHSEDVSKQHLPRTSLSTLASSECSSTQSSTYEEPDLEDFLSLDDNEVAEMSVENSVVDDISETPSESSLALRAAPFLPLSIPRPSRQATLAALEAARIASRYGFDMMYVVNLWPEEGSLGNVESGAGTKGAILAAYGLHNGPSPFGISEQVHGKILRSNGWLEYRDQDAQAEDFGCAYACAFRASAGGKREAKSNNAADRGIVFAAYRKLQANGSMRYSTESELVALRRDVEAMVEMLIDMDVARRQRHPFNHGRFLQDTGPLPSHRCYPSQ